LGVGQIVVGQPKVRWIAIVEGSTPRWPIVRNSIDRVIAAVDAAAPGSHTFTCHRKCPS